MSCVPSSVCKLCRRENMKLFLKGERCFSDKCSFDRRGYPPGQHGQARLKFSEFALQLREKQKTKRYYGVGERQFRRYFFEADRSKAVTGHKLLSLLETRLDNVIFLLGFASSRREGRLLIKHNHIAVNGSRVNLPSFNVSTGDVITVKESSRQTNKVLAGIEFWKKREMPDWLGVDHTAYQGTVKDMPSREQVTVPVEENMIVEYYSR